MGTSIIKNIVVKMPNWLGDCVMATPILHDLKKHFKEAKISVFCLPSIGKLLQDDPHIHSIITYERLSGWIHSAEHPEVISKLKMGDFDLGILLTNSFSSAWWFFRGKVRRRIGFATHFRSLLLTDKVSLPKNLEDEHLVTTYKRLLQPLGIPISPTKPTLYLNEEDKRFANDFFALHKIQKTDIVIGINPGAAYGSAKCYPKERFQEVTKKLIQNPRICVLYFGDNQGVDLVNSICYQMPSSVINLAGKTDLRQLMSLIQRCSLFLTNDSGPMHIAASFGIPLVALFGSTNPIKTGPYGGGSVINKKVPCSPCYKRTCPLPDFPCMNEITSKEVYELINSIIKEK